MVRPDVPSAASCAASSASILSRSPSALRCAVAIAAAAVAASARVRSVLACAARSAFCFSATLVAS